MDDLNNGRELINMTMDAVDDNHFEYATFQDMITVAMQYFDQNKKYKLLPKIFSKIRDFSSDEKFRTLVFSHIKILYEVLSKMEQTEHFYDLKFDSAEECLAFYMSKFFLEKINFYSTTVARPFLELEDFEEPIESIPIEAFLKPNKIIQERFMKNLKKNDILYTEVTDPDTNKINEDWTQLKVIAKVELNKCCPVYHLDIVAYMFRTIESSRLKIDCFKPFEVLKVTVLGIAAEKIFVTTNNSVLQLESSPSLGIISNHDLPFNLNLFKTGKTSLSYANYLRNHPNFNHSHIKEVIQSVGIDPHRIYSFSEKRDGSSFKTSECYEALLARASPVENIEHKRSLIHLEDAKAFAGKNEVKKALLAFEEAIKCWPKNFQVFELRGKMYFDMAGEGDKEYLFKAYEDFETALKVNPSASLSKACYESTLIRLAKRHIKKKNFKEVKSYLTKAQQLNKNNPETETLMKRLSAKMKQIRRKEEELEKRKELIVQQLKTET